MPHNACFKSNVIPTQLQARSGRFMAGARLHVFALHSGRPDRGSLRCQAAAEKETVAVTGATGLVGTRLVSKLTSQGHSVRVLTRNPNAASGKLPYPRVEVFGPSRWNDAVKGSTAVINLAGEPISTRWTQAVKAEIKQSRIAVTRQVVDAINSAPEDQRPRVLISTSAVGYYGASESQTFSEASSSGRDYLAEVCRDWEAEAQRSTAKRNVILRTGIVLAKEGGALGKMMPVFNIFAGGPLGSGRQWCSWIHRDDLVNLYIEAMQSDSFSGVYNATAPNPVRMSELCSSLGSVLGRPSWLPVPDFALQALLGGGASVVLEGQRVVPSRTQDAGFRFQYSHALLGEGASIVLEGQRVLPKRTLEQGFKFQYDDVNRAVKSIVGA
ncbi:g5594 [Coccomyxa viridis]|uniref:G5594 protein n=1 Tax=Coccomyxa viridis TaxID=1274662 RepID=A0ABP1FVY9_9CHLO